MTPDVLFLPDFLPTSQANALFQNILDTSPLRVETVTIFGKSHPTPRRTAWHADPGCVYRYSGLTHDPIPWTPPLAQLRAMVEAAAGQPFNSVLLNHYRDGRDSMGWHADNEPVFGDQPTIASLSLGGPRRFLMKHNTTGARREWLLGDGSLLIMRGRAQDDWKHSVPKTARPTRERLNLTWRMFYR